MLSGRKCGCCNVEWSSCGTSEGCVGRPREEDKDGRGWKEYEDEAEEAETRKDDALSSHLHLSTGLSSSVTVHYHHPLKSTHRRYCDFPGQGSTFDFSTVEKSSAILGCCRLILGQT